MLIDWAGLVHYLYYFQPVPVLLSSRNVAHMLNPRDLKANFEATFVPFTVFEFSKHCTC